MRLQQFARPVMLFIGWSQRNAAIVKKFNIQLN
jgi:hypothetical protein